MPTCFKAGGMPPHPHQRAAIASAIRGFRAGHRTQLIVLPTGVGKTITFGYLAKFVAEKLKGNVLVLAHTEELIGQAVEKLSRLGVDAAIEKAERRALDMALLGRKVTVGSVATLKGRRLAAWPRDHFKLVIVDEAHHAVSLSYRRILAHFDSAWTLGVTATGRGDGENLGPVFGRMAYQMTLPEAIEEGWLAPVRGVRAKVKIDLTGLRTTGKDFTDAELAPLISMAVEPLALGIKAEVGTRTTMAFTPDVRSAQALADALCQIGIPARAVWGLSTTRAADVAAFKAGDYQCLVNCDLYREGFDHPPVAAIAICRPTKNKPLLGQMVGRGTRRADGKDDCIAEGQRVLTDQGLIPIEEVTTEMKVWDGIEFVYHDGVICRGEQPVIRHAMLTATPDHKVWTASGWRTLGDCSRENIPIAVTGDGGFPIRESFAHYRRHAPGRSETPKNRGPVRGLRPGQHQGSQQRHGLQGGLPIVRQSQGGRPLALSEGGVGPAAMHESQGSGISEVRRQGHRVSLREPQGDGSMGSVGTRPSAKHGIGPDRQQRPLRAREPAVRDASTESIQHPQDADQPSEARIPNLSSGDQVCGLDPFASHQGRLDRPADHRQVQPGVVQAKRRVWDILNAGPRHRFTVEGLLVSNCLVVDFGWTIKGRLATVIDLIVPDGDPADVEAAKAKVRDGKPFDPKDLVERAKTAREAKEAAAARRERDRLNVRVKDREVHYRRISFDPVGVGRILAIRRPRPRDGIAPMPVAADLAARLADLGVRNPGSLSQREAEEYERVVLDRIEGGMATLRQIELLSRFGFDPAAAEKMDRREASAAIGRFKRFHPG